MNLVTHTFLPIAVAAAAYSGYLAALTILASLPSSRGVSKTTLPATKFAVLIPAHNEEMLVGRLLSTIKSADYPPAMIKTFVVADNCSDDTSAVARGAGANVLMRIEPDNRGKGQAIAWALDRIALDEFGAIAIIDADSMVHESFFQAANAELARGAAVIQGYYAVAPGETSTAASLRSIGFSLMHLVRGAGKRRLGGATSLKGNGMIFRVDVVRELGWESSSVTEDVEQSARLLLAGHPVRFARDAIIYSEMPSSFKDAESQNLRWEAGRLRIARKWAPTLLVNGVRRRSPAMIDAAFDLLLPPLSILALVTAGSLIIGALTAQKLLLISGAAGMLGLAIHVLGGMAVAGLSRRTYLALIAAPVYVPWKLTLYVRAFLGSGSREWIRTSRPRSNS